MPEPIGWKPIDQVYQAILQTAYCKPIDDMDYQRSRVPNSAHGSALRPPLRSQACLYAWKHRVQETLQYLSRTVVPVIILGIDNHSH